MEHYTGTEYYTEQVLTNHMQDLIAFTLTGFGVTIAAGLITWAIALGVRSLMRFIRG